TVTICGRREAALAEVAKENDRIFAIAADVTDEAEMATLYEKAEAARGPFDIVVANAGMAGSAPAHKTALVDWRRTLDVNLTGAFLTVKPALAGMLARKQGRIVFVASTAGLKGYAYVAPYVAAKHGVVGLMRALAAETAKSGVTVNAVCPGFVETDMLEESVRRIVEKTGRSADDARASLSAINPQGRFIQPEEIAAAVLWLCSDAARSVTGQAISVSGGETW
ncbi:SDR family NAD(P)-dependent oxidoreductase, partial [Mesorhizobium sp.]|uniref:SDR family NAD(P)-dependent oxidoreductase n=1 Tax=Mesorhizobium sp. TaxID=1871066 RepID=UPI000FE7988E